MTKLRGIRSHVYILGPHVSTKRNRSLSTTAGHEKRSRLRIDYLLQSPVKRQRRRAHEREREREKERENEARDCISPRALRARGQCQSHDKINSWRATDMRLDCRRVCVCVHVCVYRF